LTAMRPGMVATASAVSAVALVAAMGLSLGALSSSYSSYPPLSSSVSSVARRRTSVRGIGAGRVAAARPSMGRRPSGCARRGGMVAFSSSASCECDAGVATVTSSGVPKTVRASTLRALDLMGADGQMQNLGEKMGEGKSVVVFLRHLG